jgi:hypothetical protein
MKPRSKGVRIFRYEQKDHADYRSQFPVWERPWLRKHYARTGGWWERFGKKRIIDA